MGYIVNFHFKEKYPGNERFRMRYDRWKKSQLITPKTCKVSAVWKNQKCWKFVTCSAWEEQKVVGVAMGTGLTVNIGWKQKYAESTGMDGLFFNSNHLKFRKFFDPWNRDVPNPSILPKSDSLASSQMSVWRHTLSPDVSEILLVTPDSGWSFKMLKICWFSRFFGWLISLIKKFRKFQMIWI